MSTNTCCISFVEHSQWFAKMLANDHHIGIIGELNFEKIGVVFIKIDEPDSKLSINLNPLYRGKRLGGILLANSLLEVGELFPKLQQFTAEIRDINIASKKIFIQHGFRLHTKKVGSAIYRFNPKNA